MLALVIDDSKPVRSILARMLRDLGFTTVEAENGRLGLQHLRGPDVVQLATVNWQMPEMDGLEFVRSVRADVQFTKLPLIMITSEAEPGKIATARAAGVNGYIVKPCTRQALREQLLRINVTPPAEGTSSASSSSAESSPAAAAASSPATNPATAAAPLASVASHGAKIRVLIVDDSVVVRRAVADILESDADLQVAGTAADGRIALDRIPVVHPDVVLLDVEMPNLNGLETLKVVRQQWPRLPVIMFSSLTERGASVTTEALLLGASDYVAKPGGTHMRDAEAGREAIRSELVPKIKQLSKAHAGVSAA